MKFSIIGSPVLLNFLLMPAFYVPLKSFARSFASLLLISSLPLTAIAQTVPVKVWDKTLGGKNTEEAFCIEQTEDGGYIIAGNSSSGNSDHKTQASFGGTDFWVVKTDAKGNTLWDKTFGGAGNEVVHALIKTSDGNFVLGGSSMSPAGGSKSESGKGSFDFWIVKFNEKGGLLWDKTLGGAGYDYLYSLEEDTDGNIVAGGISESGLAARAARGGLGAADYWVVKLDAAGNQLWEGSLGKVDSETDEAYVMRLTPDGGYVLAGSLKPAPGTGKISGQGGFDYHLTRFDKNGKRLWEKTYGGNKDEFLSSMEITSDGSIVLGGISHSGKSGHKSDPARGKGDFWVIKLNAGGEKIWDRTYGGTEYDHMTLLQKTSGDDLLLGGISASSNGDKTQASNGKTDFWIIRINQEGKKIWDKSFGGSKDETLYALKETSDNGYLLAGQSFSPEGGEKTDSTKRKADFWLVKLRQQTLSWNSR